ncbi:HNH endonuclease [Nocardia arizonensis]|uniref:HNH endonuclease n=1 Tax=Nocardia arizonensis TaxID=1141647 RepID=UPI001EF3E963|nr:HNH endonuclease signature motif containing protein [Nocardia arizonensis]
MCEWPRASCRALATEVDHITPLHLGGTRYDWANLQSLCEEHHLVKSLEEAQEARRGTPAPF